MIQIEKMANGDHFFSALQSVQYPQINRLSGSSLDWLYENDSDSVALLNWLSNKLTPDCLLNEDQLHTYHQIPVSERLSGGKVLEDALESLQDQDSSFSNEDLEKEISRLESELGYYNNSCETLTALNTQLTSSETRSSLLLNQLQEETDKASREGRKVQEAVLETNSSFNIALEKLRKSIDDFVNEYNIGGSDYLKSKADVKTHVFQLDLESLISKERDLEEKLGAWINTVFGTKFCQLGLSDSEETDGEGNANNNEQVPTILDLESKDVLELVRGRDRPEFQHLKSEINRLRACFHKSELDRVQVEARESGILASLTTLKLSLRQSKNTILVSIPSNSEPEPLIPFITKMEQPSKLDTIISSEVETYINHHCQRVLITDYNIKYRRFAYLYEKLKGIRDELLQSHARQQLLDLLMVEEARQICELINDVQDTENLLQQRYRRRQGFKIGASSLEEEVRESGVGAGAGTVVKPDDQVFTSLHKLLRIADCVDPVVTYAGVEQAVASIIHNNASLQTQVQQNKTARIQRIQSIDSGIRRLAAMLHIDRFSPTTGIPLVPKEVSRSFSLLDAQIIELELKLKGILTDWQRAQSHLKTRPYHRQQRQLWIDFLLKPELVPANVRAIQNRAK